MEVALQSNLSTCNVNKLEQPTNMLCFKPYPFQTQILQHCLIEGQDKPWQENKRVSPPNQPLHLRQDAASHHRDRPCHLSGLCNCLVQ